jgi:hypothetical protein
MRAALGKSLLGRARSNSGHVRYGPITPQFCIATKRRDVPEAVMEAYSITSVAKPKTDVGISMPSIFAVFKFTPNSYLLD